MLGTCFLSQNQPSKWSWNKEDVHLDDTTWNDVPYNSTTGLLWFVHLTDLHLSQESLLDLQSFCQLLREEIRPPVVVVTGDMISTGEDCRSYKDLWQRQCTTDNETLWLDISGNHEQSDSPEPCQAQESGQSYLKTVHFGNKDFSFVGIDATMVKGPKPFHHHASLTQNQATKLESLLERSKGLSDGGMVTFSHFPLSTIFSPNPGIKNLVGDVNAHLSGHLHDVFGLSNKMYTVQPSGFLDLVLADWLRNRKFRVVALDRGHLSFHGSTLHVKHQSCHLDFQSVGSQVHFRTEDSVRFRIHVELDSRTSLSFL